MQRHASLLVALVLTSACERNDTPSAIPFPPRSCAVSPGTASGTEVPPFDFTLVTGSPETLADQYTKPRYVNFFPPKTFAQMSELREENWSPESAGTPTRRGTYEVTVFPCDDTWTSHQQGEANELIEKTRKAAERHGWFDFDKAVADGFHPMLGISDHWVNDEFANDGRVLDPDRPEFLMYYDTEDGKVLSGIMYVMPGIGLRGPQIGGPQTIWHYHIMPPACYVNGIAVELPDENGRCRRGVKSEMSPEMVHVWFIDRANGPFSSAMLPPKRPDTTDGKGGRSGNARRRSGLQVGRAGEIPLSEKDATGRDARRDHEATNRRTPERAASRSASG